MNLAFKEVFGSANPTLPLQDGGNIICGNATLLDWVEVCPKDEEAEIYILGNPPYLGAKMQSKAQKIELSNIFEGIKGHKSLDYIACWFSKGADYIEGTIAKFAFVSTNSVCQGEQVALLWPIVLKKHLEICFAYQSFKWTNNARGNAGVTCAIVGVRNFSNKAKKIYYDHHISAVAKNINSYLVDAGNTFVSRRSLPVSNFPLMKIGNKPIDGGNYLFAPDEKKQFIKLEPGSSDYFFRWYGSREFLQGIERWCLLVQRMPSELLPSLPHTQKRIENVRQIRLSSKSKPTRNISNTPEKFHVENFPNTSYIIIPKVSSERRLYIPVAFLSPDDLASDLLNVIANPSTHIFAIISSCIHMTWVRAVAGRLKTDYRYSSSLCYNTFPFPEITKAQKTTLDDHVFKVLDERELHPEKTMAQLYDPDKMPDGLRQAHHEMDISIEKCYRSRPFKNDEERLEYLFKLYEEMIEAEKQK